jgi:hypothetical protein
VTNEQKALEPMVIAGTITYGNYFRMAGRGAFRIGVEVRRPGETRATTVQFMHQNR